MVKQRERWIICSSGQGWRLPAVAFDTVQNAVLSPRALQTAVHSIALHYLALHCTESTAQQCVVLHSTALHCTVLCCITLHCSTLLSRAALQCTLQQWHILLHCIIFHFHICQTIVQMWNPPKLIEQCTTLSFTALSESCVSLHVLRYCIKVTERVCIAVHCIVIHQTVMHHTVLHCTVLSCPGTIPLHWIWAPNDPNAPNDRAPLRRRVVIRPVVVPIFKIACVSFCYWQWLYLCLYLYLCVWGTLIQRRHLMKCD